LFKNLAQRLTALCVTRMANPIIEKFHMSSDRWTTSNSNYKPIDGAVIHYDASPTLEGSMRYMLEYVDKDDSKSASYHYLLGDGRIIEFNDPALTRAWHAGRSEYQGMSSLNRNTVGIAIRNYGWADDYDADTNRTVYAPNRAGVFKYWEPYAYQDIDNLIWLINELDNEYTFRFIAGHEDVAMGRKVDPGPLFPWQAIWEGLGWASRGP